MLLIRLRQIVDLVRPTARAMSWHPPVWAAVLALGYVLKEAPSAYIEYRILVLRVAALLLCIASAFVLDDATEETIGHVPTPLLMRRGLRIALLLPLVASTWIGVVNVAGDVAVRDGGPMPAGDLTLEAATLLAIALCASCVGARLASDRVGGIAAAPIVLGLVAVALFLPPDQKMILGSPSDPRWADAHEWWRAALVSAAVVFLWVNRSPGSYRAVARRRALKSAPRTL
ncbi:MAG TPA: hypothetical protein VG929_02035 [Actinomycetota bacterium]|nr:hypothetical protein [Actinomycetota bacterium]